jgi:hypothetical protein
MTPVDSLKARIEMLERSVMELGSELFVLKNGHAKHQDSNDQFIAIVKGLKQLLDEKGLVSLEDFDAAVELGEVIERFNAQMDAPGHDIEKKLKTGH